MLGRNKGDYLLPLLFFEADIRTHFRGVVININPDGLSVVCNDRRFLELASAPSVAGLFESVFVLEFNFFDLDTTNITGAIQKIRPGLFKGYEMLIDFRFTRIDPITKRDINRIIQAQRLT